MLVTHPRWALCIGGGSCVWDDVLAWEDLYGKQWDGIVIAANDIGCHWPRPLHHWATLHAENLKAWQALRAKQKLPIDNVCTTWTRQARFVGPGLADHQIDPWAGGSSGMLAVQVAAHLGCTRAVLCGIPLTPTPHFRETKESFHAQWLASAGHWRAWPKYLSKMEGWVKSMSGRTQELLGAPTREWLLAGAE